MLFILILLLDILKHFYKKVDRFSLQRHWGFCFWFFGIGSWQKKNHREPYHPFEVMKAWTPTVGLLSSWAPFPENEGLELMGCGSMFLLPKPWVTEEMAWWLWFIARLSQCSCTLREMSGLGRNIGRVSRKFKACQCRDVFCGQDQKLVPWLPLFTLSCTSFESQNIGKKSVIRRF